MASNLKPFVLKNSISSWPAGKWTPKNLANQLKGKLISARFGAKQHRKGEILWETLSPRETLTLEEFNAWEEGGCPRIQQKYPSSENWGYIDYKYLFELLDEDQFEAIDWSVFDIEKDAVDSTFWLGTPGAYTPCHYDTYGFNLHAQIFGRKRWILFPPSASNVLKPTRLPYEESSVFSSLDILGAPTQLSAQPKISGSASCSENNSVVPIYMVTLEPGDVLYLPPYWWHFVQTLETSISVNTWIPIEADKEMRQNEAITKALVALFHQGNLLPSDRSICPSETSLRLDECLSDLTQLRSGSNTEESEPSAKRRKEDHDIHRKFVRDFNPKGSDVLTVSFAEFMTAMSSGPLNITGEERKSPETKADNITKDSLVDALLHPSVISRLNDILFC